MVKLLKYENDFHLQYKINLMKFSGKNMRILLIEKFNKNKYRKNSCFQQHNNFHSEFTFRTWNLFHIDENENMRRRTKENGEEKSMMKGKKTNDGCCRSFYLPCWCVNLDEFSMRFSSKVRRYSWEKWEF